MLLSILHNVMLPINYYFSHMFFSITHINLNKKIGRKMANNFTALTHATGCTILAGRYLLNKTENNYNALTAFSSGYFIYDLLYLTKYWEPKQLNYAYLYHHMTSLYLMHQNPTMFKGAHILFFGELSNIPTYLVYYFQKQPNKKKLLKKLKYLQFLLYAGIRIPIIGKILEDVYYNSKETGNYLPLIVGSPVFLMGLIWSKKLFYKL